MAITYNKLSEKEREWGIEIVVQFLDDGVVTCTKTFLFDSVDEIKNEFENRMIRAISNVQDDIDEKKKPKEIDVYDRIKDYFKDNTELTKEDFDTMKTEELSTKVKK